MKIVNYNYNSKNYSNRQTFQGYGRLFAETAEGLKEVTVKNPKAIFKAAGAKLFITSPRKSFLGLIKSQIPDVIVEADRIIMMGGKTKSLNAKQIMVGANSKIINEISGSDVYMMDSSEAKNIIGNILFQFDVSKSKIAQVVKMAMFDRASTKNVDAKDIFFQLGLTQATTAKSKMAYLFDGSTSKDVLFEKLLICDRANIKNGRAEDAEIIGNYTRKNIQTKKVILYSNVTDKFDEVEKIKNEITKEAKEIKTYHQKTYKELVKGLVGKVAELIPG